MQGVRGHYLGGERVDQRLESHRRVAPTQPDKVEVASAATGRIRRNLGVRARMDQGLNSAPRTNPLSREGVCVVVVAFSAAAVIA